MQFLREKQLAEQIKTKTNQMSMSSAFLNAGQCAFAVFVGYLSMASALAVTVAKVMPQSLRDQMAQQEALANDEDNQQQGIDRKKLLKRQRQFQRSLKPIPSWYLTINMVLSAVFAAMGSMICSHFDPYQTEVHFMLPVLPSSLYLALFVFIVGLGYFLDYRRQSRRREQLEPNWYRVYLLVIGPVAACFGSFAYVLLYLPK